MFVNGIEGNCSRRRIKGELRSAGRVGAFHAYRIPKNGAKALSRAQTRTKTRVRVGSIALLDSVLTVLFLGWIESEPA